MLLFQPLKHRGALAWARAFSSQAPPSSQAKKPPARSPASTPAAAAALPDYNTPVDVAGHSLRKPKRDSWRPPPLAEGSLIPETLRQMEGDAEFQLTASRLKQVGVGHLGKCFTFFVFSCFRQFFFARAYKNRDPSVRVERERERERDAVRSFRAPRCNKKNIPLSVAQCGVC